MKITIRHFSAVLVSVLNFIWIFFFLPTYSHGQSANTKGAPVNDSCASAIEIFTGDTLFGTTTGAGNTDAPTICGSTLNTAGGVWYKFTGNGHFVNANTCYLDDYDAKMAVFTGSCASLSCVGGMDDSCGSLGRQPSFSFCADSGVVYYIYITGSGTDEGDFYLCINNTPSAPPVILNCPHDSSFFIAPADCGPTLIIPIPQFGTEYTDDCIHEIFNDHTWTNDASGIYQIGTTVVTWTVNDGDGQSAGCQQHIYVYDTNSPLPYCLDNIYRELAPGHCSEEILINPLNGFAGYFAPDNWNYSSYYVNSTFDTTQAPDTIVIINNNLGITSPGYSNFSISSPCDNDFIEFSYTCISTDPSKNYPQYSLDGVSYTVFPGFNTGSAPGAQSAGFGLNIDSAQILTIQMHTENYNFGTDTLILSDFLNSCTNLIVMNSCGDLSLSNNHPDNTFESGDFNVVWTVTDQYGNSGSCTQLISVHESIPPEITCPADLIVQLDSASSFATGVDLGIPNATDNCLVDTTFNNGIEPYPLGITTILWTVMDASGNIDTCHQTLTVVDTITGISESAEQAETFLSIQPNPFDEQTNIHWFVAAACRVSLNITNLLGENVYSLIHDEYTLPGHYTNTLNARTAGLSPGLYFIKLEMGNVFLIRKMMVN